MRWGVCVVLCLSVCLEGVGGIGGWVVGVRM